MVLPNFSSLCAFRVIETSLYPVGTDICSKPNSEKLTGKLFNEPFNFATHPRQ